MLPTQITCTPPQASNTNITIKVIDHTPDQFHCFIKTPLVIIGAVLTGIGVSLIIALPCYKYRWYISHCSLILKAMKKKN